MKLNDLSYDLPIVNRAIVDYMIKGVPVEKTVYDCNELKEFQLVAKISNKYTHILHGDKRKQILQRFKPELKNCGNRLNTLKR